MSNISLSLMEECDLEDVLEVSSLSKRNLGVEESFKKELSNPLAKYLVAKENNKVIGFAGVWTIVDEGHITNIAVHPNFREKGIGSILLSSLIEHCKNWGCNSLTLEVRASNTPAQNLYKKYTFKEEGIRKKYYKDNNEEMLL